MNDDFNLQLAEFAAENGWTSTETILHLSNFIESQGLEWAAMQFLNSCALEDQTRKLRQDEELERVNEEYLANQFDQDYFAEDDGFIAGLEDDMERNCDGD